MNAVTDMVLNSARKLPLQTRPAGRLPAPIPAGAAVWVERRLPAALHLARRAAEGLPCTGKLQKPGLLSGGSRLPWRLLCCCSGCSHAWAWPPAGVWRCTRARRARPWCHCARPGVPLCPVVARVLVALQRPCGAGLAVLSRAGRGFPLMWLKRLSNTAQEALIQPFPCSCKLL